MNQNGLQLRAEAESGSEPRKIQGFDSQPVPGQDESTLQRVPDSDRKHASEATETSRAPLFEGRQHHLCIASRPKPASARFELLPQLRMIVDLAVVDNHKSAIFAFKRLIRRLGVDHPEPHGAERNVI